ncbi:hypothetical protein GHO41_15495 [Pseudomonas sp. FSL R10-0399]|uniref:neuraminidase-like domain-containing protein n=1 Tax=Pseudomonas sp. FSL R10-0399 TaxID=2662194 RepID=UPI001294C4B5|nr:neuraminidase-like domain-containing protein [Pseudomonas sp. FSL R10-0399]MQT58737.1 hypothetical protein [Pseudomonas sp. FSL R10-0399]
MPHTLDQQLNEKLRTAQLALYLTHAVSQDTVVKRLGLAQTLKTAEDLYTHWLLDVLVSQAVPTSRVACAIASLQQYVNGISLGLEPGYDVEGMSSDQLATWQNTLQNYSIWHANQQLRYFPSTFLNPELRNNKTDNFQKTENDINQNRIQSSTVFSAVQSFLGRFEDIANLTTLNGYINGHIDNMANSTYYFVGKSRSENTYYWRSLDMAKRATAPFSDSSSTSKLDTPEPSAWTDWEKIPLPTSENIPDRSVRPVYFNNRLFIIWAQITKPTSSFGGPSQLSETTDIQTSEQFKVRSESNLRMRYSKVSLNFIHRKPDGSWSTPKVCIDEYNHTTPSTENINSATTTIATVDRSTTPHSLFLGIHIEGGGNTKSEATSDLTQGFYQAIRLDLQFGIRHLYSAGASHDFSAFSKYGNPSERYAAIFAIHNKFNFNFHGPLSKIIKVEHFKNSTPNPKSASWNYEDKQDHIKDFSEDSELQLNITTNSLEITSTLTKDFPQHQKLLFDFSNDQDEIRLELITIFSSTDQQEKTLHSGSSITSTQQELAGQHLLNIAITNTRTRQTFSGFITPPSKSQEFKIESRDITLDLSNWTIDQDIFKQLFISINDSYSISIEVQFQNEEKTTKHFNLESGKLNSFYRTYKHIIMRLLDTEVPTPPKITRETTLILGENHRHSRHYLKGTSLELKSGHSISAQVQPNAPSPRPNNENDEQILTQPEQNGFTLLHGVIILEVKLRDSEPYILGYALKALTTTPNKETKLIIPLAPRLTRITSNNNSPTEFIDFSGSNIKYSDPPHRGVHRQPIRMNTGFAKTLTEAASISLETLFSLPSHAWREAPLTVYDNDMLLNFHGAYGKYYWELFLYLPWLVAYRLNMEQRYAEAQEWLHYLFNPGSKTDPKDKKSSLNS